MTTTKIVQLNADLVLRETLHLYLLVELWSGSDPSHESRIHLYVFPSSFQKVYGQIVFLGTVIAVTIIMPGQLLGAATLALLIAAWAPCITARELFER